MLDLDLSMIYNGVKPDEDKLEDKPSQHSF